MAEITCNYCNTKSASARLILKERDDEGYPKKKCSQCDKKEK